MSPASLIDDLPGVRGCVVTDDSGTVLEVAGEVQEADIVAAQVATVARDIRSIGLTLQLGGAALVSIQGPQATRVIAFQGGTMASVELEGKRSTADLEARLRDQDWASRFAPPPPPPPPPVAPGPEPPPVVPAAATGERAAVFSGNLQLFAVPDLLEFLRNSQRSGTLTCRSESGVGIVQLARGKITHAMSPATGGIGEHMVRAGSLAREALLELYHPEEPDPPSDDVVGRWLLERGILSAADLRAALVARVQAALHELVTWDEGRFAFDPGAIVAAGVPGVDVTLDPQQLLLNIFRQQDEANRAR